MTLLAQLRPQRVTEILDASVQFYRSQARVLLIIAATLYIPPLLLIAIAPSGMGSYVGLALVLPASVIQGAIALTVAAAVEGTRIDAGEALSRLRGRIGTLMGVQLATLALIVLGMVFLIVPGIMVMVFTTVALPAAAIERVPVSVAISRSSELARGKFGHVLGTQLLALTIFYILYFGGAYLVGLVAGAIGIGERLAELFGTMLFVPFYPIFAVALTLLYYDLRVRKEGADLEAMAAALPAPPAPTSAAR